MEIKIDKGEYKCTAFPTDCPLVDLEVSATYNIYSYAEPPTHLFTDY